MLQSERMRWVSWVRGHGYLVAGIVVALFLAAIVAVPLSLGQPMAIQQAAVPGHATASSSVAVSGAVKSTAPMPAAAAPATVNQAAGVGSADLLQGRDIVRRANVELTVSDVRKAYQDVLQLVQGRGGYALQSNLANYPDQSAASLQVQVPVAGLASFIDAVSRLGHVDTQGQSGSDVTQQVVDVKARLQVLQAEESQLLTFLRQAKTVGDMLKVEEQLQSTRTQIEELQAQQKTLSTQVAMATVDITLHAAAPAIASNGGRSGFAGQIWRVFTVAFYTLAYALGRLALAVVWLVPFGALAAVVYAGWRAYRRFRARHR